MFISVRPLQLPRRYTNIEIEHWVDKPTAFDVDVNVDERSILL